MSTNTQWVGLKTIVTKELIRIQRIWIQTLIPPAITMTLYFVIFGSLIGERIGQMSNFSYMEFIAPGLIMMSIISNAYGNVAASFYGSKFGRNVEEILVSPLTNLTILTGYVLGGVARGLAVGAIVTVVALFFTDLHIAHPWIVFSSVLLTALVFSLAGFINAVFANSFEEISIIPTFILTPLTYLGGVFYSITLLPDVWQTVSKANPILYMVNAFRYGILGVSDTSMATAYAIIIGFVIALFLFALWLLRRGTGLRT